MRRKLFHEPWGEIFWFICILAYIVLIISLQSCTPEGYCKCHQEIWQNDSCIFNGTTIVEDECREWTDTTRFGDNIQVVKYICE